MENILLKEIPLTPIEKLEQSLFVEDKILTYKTASALLGIKTNESQEYFLQYIKQCNQPEKKVYLTYILGGTTTEGQRKVMIVDENNYETVKSGFESLFIDKIYSLQKSPNITWESIFNIDDFLYTEKKTITKTITKPVFDEEPKRVEKKGSITNFMNQPTHKPMETKSEKKPPPPKNDKKNNIKNMFSKMPNKPKETTNEIKNNTNGKMEIDDDDEVIVRKTNGKKRGRIMIEDDDEEDGNIPAKQVKSDILDSDNESEKENVKSDSEDEQTMEVDTPESDKEICKEPPKEIEKPEEIPIEENMIDEPKKIEEPKDIMYEDDDGFFVTEKSSKKRVHESKPLTETEKKEIKKKTAVEKQQKKEVNDKLKKNTNQKTLFNFFKKT